MRAVFAVSALALLCPVAAFGQNPAPARGADITKDQYVEQAQQRAAKRFDKLDANHDGVLTAEERRAARKKRRKPE